jgi:ABC-2 type transport system ATP-binding protein
MSHSSLLSFDGVTKFYGPVIGVNHISFQLNEGITGLLGANGAGKSTLIKLASGQLRPSQGAVRIGDHSAWSSGAKRLLGYAPDIDSFYEEMTGRRFVTAMARLYGYPKSEAAERADRAIETVGMTDRAGRRIAGCSHGMRQRIKLAQALIHDPELLLLDEPMSGIDPGGRRDLHDLLHGLAKRGKTILVSSHILAEVEQLTDSLLVVARGRIVARGSLPEIRNLMENRPTTIEIEAQAARRLAGMLAQSPDVRAIEIREESLVVRTDRAAAFFARLGELVLSQGVEVRKLQTLDAGAEAVFDYLQRGPA